MQWESNMAFCFFKFHIPPNTVVLCNAEIPNNHILLVWENKVQLRNLHSFN